MQRELCAVSARRGSGSRCQHAVSSPLAGVLYEVKGSSVCGDQIFPSLRPSFLISVIYYSRLNPLSNFLEIGLGVLYRKPWNVDASHTVLNSANVFVLTAATFIDQFQCSSSHSVSRYC